MKVGIVTFTYGDNYGQRLQNLAVQETIKKYGFDVFTLRQVNRTSLRYRLKVAVKRIITNKIWGNIKRHRNFRKFDNENIQYWDERISEGRILESLADFDFFVAGSDQIWSPYSTDVNSTMFLTFAPREKRISFSPSMAAEEVPREKRELFKKYLEGFSSISVREEKTADIIFELTGRRAEVHIDPTLMFDASFWRRYEMEPKFKLPHQYALCYFLGKEEHKEKISEICDKNGLEVLDFSKKSKLYAMGPAEFLYLIRNSSVVFTDSYHGTIFSILFQRPFVVCSRVGTELNMNSRFDTLFHKLSFTGRTLDDCFDKNLFQMDFSTIFIALERERQQVKKYLDERFNICNAMHE